MLAMAAVNACRPAAMRSGKVSASPSSLAARAMVFSEVSGILRVAREIDSRCKSSFSRAAAARTSAEGSLELELLALWGGIRAGA